MRWWKSPPGSSRSGSASGDPDRNGGRAATVQTAEDIQGRPFVGLAGHLLDRAMGATAAHAVFGRATPIGKIRGRRIPLGGREVPMTVHPSFLLRQADEEAREREYAAFVADLRRAAA
jgi:uracil-DNA glycosylase